MDWRCDKLSRLGGIGLVEGCRGALNGMERSLTPVVNLGIPVLDLLALCNPEAELVEESDVSEFWN